MQDSNSSYISILDSLFHGEYDFAIGGVSLTNSRRQAVQFGSVLRFEDVAFMYNYDRPFYKQLFLLNAIFNHKIFISIATRAASP